MTPYTPSKKTLEKYADVLVNFALGGGKGIRKSDVVRITAWQEAAPLFTAVQKSIAKSGGYVLPNFLVSGATRHGLTPDFVENASKKQLSFIPQKFIDGVVAECDHEIILIAEDKDSFSHVDPKNIMAIQEHLHGPYMKTRTAKESAGNFSWTLCLYGTEQAAKESGLSLEGYWRQIIKACYLDKADPVAEWKKTYKEMSRIESKLNELNIHKLHITGSKTDLWITLGERRAWVSGRGANIPSFEIFTSPDWRGTEGYIEFNLPLYRYGNKVERVCLEFKKGEVVKATARKGQEILHELVRTKGANRIGEFSLTDKRHSKINKFMSETLFDENFGGKYGNSHLALGQAYASCYDGDVTKFTLKEQVALGFNQSPIHADIIQTDDRTVTAHLNDGSEICIYEKGMFTF